MRRRGGGALAWLGRGINAPLALGAIALLADPLLVATPYALRLMTVAGIYALLVIGYQFIFGHAGALSLAQGAFFGLGAYATGILGSRWGWGFLATFPVSLALPVLLAALVAAPVLRLESHYFALATLGVGQVLLLVAINWQGVTGGANGLPGVPGIVLFGMAVPRGWPLLAAVWAAVALGGVIAWQATRGGFGMALGVLRDNPMAAAAIGLDAGALRFAAFLSSALYAGAAGALYGHTIRVVSPDAIGFPIMVSCLTMAVVGGRGRIAGAILGAVLLVHLPEWLRVLDGAYLLAYGLALLAVIILAPDGLVGALAALRARLSPEPPPPLPPPRAPAPPMPRPAGPGPLLRAAGLAKRFGGVEALAGIDLAVSSGEILGLIGPNGSGKTTLVNLVSGIDRADRGSIAFAGQSIGGLSPHIIARRGVARTFQTGNLVEAMTAIDAVAVARLAVTGGVGLMRSLVRPGADPATAAARGEAAHLLARLGVGESATQPCGSLPHGLRRRVEIARALALDPALLLLDEPAAGLDTAEQADLARRLAGLADGGLALIVIEHNMAFLMPLAHRILCLDRGRIIAAGRPDEIRRDPRVLAAYLGAPPAAAP